MPSQNDNLPPGCGVIDIPGNSIFDEYFDNAYAILEKRWREEGLCECDSCSYREEMVCHKSELFYEWKCPVIEQQAETIAREMEER